MSKRNPTLKEEVIRGVERQIAGWKEHLTKFEQEFQRDPAWAFEWAERPVEAACRVRVLTSILNALNADSTVDSVIKSSLKYALNGAKWGSNSTSAMKNLTDRYTAQAWAMFYEEYSAYAGLVDSK